MIKIASIKFRTLMYRSRGLFFFLTERLLYDIYQLKRFFVNKLHYGKFLLIQINSKHSVLKNKQKNKTKNQKPLFK